MSGNPFEDFAFEQLGATPLLIREEIEKLLEPVLKDTSEAVHSLARDMPAQAVVLLPLIHALAVKQTMLDLKLSLVMNMTGPMSRIAHREAVVYLNERMRSVNAEIEKEWTGQ